MERDEDTRGLGLYWALGTPQRWNASWGLESMGGKLETIVVSPNKANPKSTPK